MNAHTPFDANQDWTNPYCQNSSNDPMVDALLGNAYHVVRTVYCNLGNLKLIYDFLNQYGMVLGVQSEAELKALTTKAKYARIYGFSRAGDRQVTDYLYVEGDHTGIIPDDPEATGSWITVATSGSNGGGVSSGEGAYIPWVYSNGSATGGETTINVPDGTVGVPFIIINGDMQYVGRGFEFNVDSLSVTLAQPLEEGDEVVFLLTGVPAVPDNPNVSDWIQINWLYNNGAAVGGEQVIAIPYIFQSVPAVYRNGLRLYKGLTTESYTADPDNQRILLTEPLATNDRLIVQIGGEAQVLEASDHTLQEVARATNVKDSEVILSTDTTQFLNGKKIVYSVSEQKAYGLPSLPTNVYISSVSNGQLTYSPGNIVVDLVPVPGSTESLTASDVPTTSGGTVQDELDSIDVFIDTDLYKRVGDIRGYTTTQDVTPVNAVIAANQSVGIVRVPKGNWTGNFALLNKTSLEGTSLTTTTLTVPSNTAGIKPSGTDVRGINISNIAMQVAGAVTGGAPIGTGIGLDMTDCTKMVNCTISNIYSDFFDIGFKAGPADFSNVYNNIRCNNNRIGFDISSNGQIIQNTWNSPYVANWTQIGMKLSGVGGTVINTPNFGHNGTAGAYFLHIDTNTRGVIVNSANFEMDAVGGKLSAGGQGIIVASDSSVTFNSPIFNKVGAAGPNTYLFRIRGTAVVHINNPQIYNDDGIVGHLRVEDTATVYLNDPKGVFTSISVAAGATLVRVHERIKNAPSFTSLQSVQSGTVVNVGFYPTYAIGVPDFHATTMPGTFKYAVSFDSYNSTNGTMTARVYDTTTGLGVSSVAIPTFIQAWR